jgi:hypothetical protein
MDQKQIEIGSYKVLLVRGEGYSFFRTLALLPRAADRDEKTVDAVFIGFHDGSVDNFGYSGGGREVYCWAPMSDFDNFYHVLQTEKPLFLEWTFEGNSGRVTSFQLRSAAEPLGEGFRDVSP